jgi:hemoglobin
MEAKTPTLYDWAGGIERIEALFGAFYERVPADAVLGPVFAQMSQDHFHVVAHFVAEVLGGPKLYTDNRLHSHSSMVAKPSDQLRDDRKSYRKRCTDASMGMG